MNRNKHVLLLVLFAIPLACACANSGKPHAPSPAKSAACNLDIPGLTEFLPPAGLLIVGELHGTRQIPTVVSEVVCHASKTGPVVLAVELETTDQPVLDAFLAEPTDDVALARLLESNHWRRDFQDGRSSAAMAAMLNRARSLRRGGRDILIRAFAPVGTSSDDYEQAMADNIARIRRDHPNAHVIVLVGNVHGKTTKGTPWNAEFVPMAAHLIRDVPQLKALFATHDSGSAWVCTGAEHSCGPHEMGGKDLGDTPFARPDTAQSGYHGILYVGAIDASPPATQANQ